MGLPSCHCVVTYCFEDKNSILLAGWETFSITQVMILKLFPRISLQVQARSSPEFSNEHSCKTKNLFFTVFCVLWAFMLLCVNVPDNSLAVLSWKAIFGILHTRIFSEVMKLTYHCSYHISLKLKERKVCVECHLLTEARVWTFFLTPERKKAVKRKKLSNEINQLRNF